MRRTLAAVVAVNLIFTAPGLIPYQALARTLSTSGGLTRPISAGPIVLKSGTALLPAQLAVFPGLSPNASAPPAIDAARVPAGGLLASVAQTVPAIDVKLREDNSEGLQIAAATPFDAAPQSLPSDALPSGLASTPGPGFAAAALIAPAVPVSARQRLIPSPGLQLRRSAARIGRPLLAAAGLGLAAAAIHSLPPGALAMIEGIPVTLAFWWMLPMVWVSTAVYVAARAIQAMGAGFGGKAERASRAIEYQERRAAAARRHSPLGYSDLLNNADRYSLQRIRFKKNISRHMALPLLKRHGLENVTLTKPKRTGSFEAELSNLRISGRDALYLYQAMSSSNLVEAVIGDWPQEADRVLAEADWTDILPAQFHKADPFLRYLVFAFVKRLPLEQRRSLESAFSGKKLSREEAFKLLFETVGMEKLGQYLALRSDLVPESFRKSFQKFFEHVDPSPRREIEETIQRELHQRPDEIFSRLEFKNAGTIADFYEGVLASNGRRVGIKVITPSRENRIRMTLDILRETAEEVDANISKFNVRLDLKGLFRQFSRLMRKQLDLRAERRNALDFARALRNMPKQEAQGIAIPMFSRDYSTRRVLVMSFAAGQDPALSPVERRKELVHRLARIFFRSILQGQIRHDDLHPGNIRDEPSQNRVTLIDFGDMGQMDVPDLRRLFNFIIAARAKDADALQAALESMSAPQSDYDAQQLRGVVEKLLAIEGATLLQIIDTLFYEARGHQLYVHDSFLQLFKGLSTFEGLAQNLDPGYSLIDDLTSFVQEHPQELLAILQGPEPVKTESPKRSDRQEGRRSGMLLSLAIPGALGSMLLESAGWMHLPLTLLLLGLLYVSQQGQRRIPIPSLFGLLAAGGKLLPKIGPLLAALAKAPGGSKRSAGALQEFLFPTGLLALPSVGYLAAAHPLWREIAEKKFAELEVDVSGAASQWLGQLEQLIKGNEAAARQAGQAIRSELDSVWDLHEKPSKEAVDAAIVWLLSAAINQALRLQELSGKTISPPQRNAVVKEMGLILQHLGIPASALPQDWQAVETAANAVSDLVVDATAQGWVERLRQSQAVSQTVPPALLDAAEFISASLLPEPVRSAYGYRRGQTDDADLGRFMTMIQGLLKRP